MAVVNTKYIASYDLPLVHLSQKNMLWSSMIPDDVSEVPLATLRHNISAYFFFPSLLQHVVEKGKSHERAQIISKLAGQVVTMSQNKFYYFYIVFCLFVFCT